MCGGVCRVVCGGVCSVVCGGVCSVVCGGGVGCGFCVVVCVCVCVCERWSCRVSKTIVLLETVKALTLALDLNLPQRTSDNIVLAKNHKQNIII